MILSGEEIKNRLGKDIVIDPFYEKCINPNSYNLHLFNELLVYKSELLDSAQNNETEKIEISQEGFILQPNQLYLARTVEYTETHNLVPIMKGRSSIGRLGIQIHITSGFGDVGFCGYWTLQITCIIPVKIYPFMEICQIYYQPILGSYIEYKSKYQNNDCIQASKMYMELKSRNEKKELF